MKTKHLFIVALVALIVGLLAKNQFGETERHMSDMVSGTWLQPAKQIPDFSLVDQNGEAFTAADLQGKWSILFFGFINCPDICPSTMRFLKNIKSDLTGKNAWENKQVVFVSVDPERDKAENLKPYISHFDAEFVGVTGELAAITAFTKSLSMPFVKEAVNEFGGYNVAHNSSFLVLNPKGQLAAIISTPHDHSEIVYDLAGKPFTQ